LLTKLSSENSIGVKGVVMGVNYGIDKLRFLAPVRAGKRIRAHTEVLNVDRKDATRFLVKTGVTVEIEGEETPALYAEWLGMQFIA
jgi:acyl dehydratase